MGCEGSFFLLYFMEIFVKVRGLGIRHKANLGPETCNLYMHINVKFWKINHKRYDRPCRERHLYYTLRLTAYT